MVSSNIETDSFDRELFGDFEESSEELSALIERGSTLLPNFRYLAQDLFASFYKHNVLLFPIEFVEFASRFSRKLILKVLESELYAELREETLLDGFNSALAAATVLDRLLAWLKSQDGMGANSLLREWEIAEAEGDLRETEMKSETMEEMEQGEGTEEAEKGEGGEYKDTLSRVKKDNELARRRQEKELKELADEQERAMENLDMKLKTLAQSATKEAMERVDEVDRNLAQWGSAVGSGAGGKGLGEKLDLAEKLNKSRNLKRLAMLVGALKEEMLNARRKSWSRRGDEVYEIGFGNDLAYLIPSELVALSSPLLRKDFFKKYVEHGLLQYRLKEEKGRGPVIVCLDGSSSMHGDKEIWSKALTLSFGELAKRQRRRFSVVVFSSKGAPLRVFSSSAAGGVGIDESQVLELADYFPGGGTDFESPLDKSLELLGERKFAAADVLFITDGECDVSEQWLEAFMGKKAEQGLNVYSVLIDLTGRESARSLTKFSDKVTTISNLKSNDARDIFLDFK